MHKLAMTTRSKKIAIAAIVVALLAGCSQTKSFVSWMSKTPTSPSGEPVILGAPDAEHYLQEMYDLAAGDASYLGSSEANVTILHFLDYQ